MRCKQGPRKSPKKSNERRRRSGHAAPDKATSIEAVIIPTYEVPRTAPPTEEDADDNPTFGKLSGIVLDMKVLAESDAKKLPKQLEPLVAAYREWIDREEAKLKDPQEGLLQFGDAGSVAIDNCRLAAQGTPFVEGMAEIPHRNEFSRACRWLFGWQFGCATVGVKRGQKIFLKIRGPFLRRLSQS